LFSLVFVLAFVIVGHFAGGFGLVWRQIFVFFLLVLFDVFLLFFFANLLAEKSRREIYATKRCQ